MEDRKNRIFFGLGTVGRDVMYAMLGSYLLVFLTEGLNLPDATMWWLSGLLVALRLFDAVNDPLMGLLVDNTRSRFGKFKPGMLLGALVSSLFLVLLFTDTGLRGGPFLLVFALLSVGWDLGYGLNDVAYWSMLPALSLSSAERERAGAFARICANAGTYLAAVLVLPAVGALRNRGFGEARAWTLTAAAVAALTVGFQLFTLLGVREGRSRFQPAQRTGLRQMLGAVARNDQLLCVSAAMTLFMAGYITATGFGLYFFKYVYGEEGLFVPFAALLGAVQTGALALYPAVSRRLNRRRLFSLVTALTSAGYLGFFFSPLRFLPLALAGALIAAGQAFIQILMLVSLADTVEYGQLRTGRRSESVTLSLQPLICKLASALAAGIISVTLILSGINAAQGPGDLKPRGILLFKAVMLLLPLLFALAAGHIFRRGFRIDRELHARIVETLRQRGDLSPDPREASPCPGKEPGL